MSTAKARDLPRNGGSRQAASCSGGYSNEPWHDGGTQKGATLIDRTQVWRACAWLLVACLAACKPASPEQFRWRLDLTSTGGVGGQGSGQVLVTSDGKVESSRLGLSCSVKLGADDLRAVQQAVGAVAPGNWGTADYEAPKAQDCCDRISWRLDVTLEMSDGTKRSVHADWHEAAMEQLPPDLRALAMVAERILDGSMDKCRSR